MSVMRKLIFAAAVWMAGAVPAIAQSAPGWGYGYVPTPAEWNAAWASKQDYLGGAPLLVTGGTMTGPLVTAASSTLAAGFNLQPGVAPASPINGDMWSTTFGVFARINGSTVGPFVAGSGSPSTVGDIAIFTNTGGAIGDAGGGIPNLPLAHPSSGNAVGGGCVTAHQAWWVDQNMCATGDQWQWVSNDPSALGVLTFAGTPVTGHVYTINFIYNSTTVPVTYTAQAGDTIGSVIAGVACAVANNATLFNLNGGTCAGGVVTAAAGSFFGGYGGSHQIGYVVINGANQVSFDYNSAVNMQMSYSVTGGGTETVTFPAGWFAGTLYNAGTSTGSANAQVISASGFTLSAGKSITFVAGFSNSGAATLNAQGTGATAIQKYINGALANLAGGEIVAGTLYTVAYNGSTFTLQLNAVHVAGGSTASTTYQLPNSLDNNPAFVMGRVPGGASPAPGSVTAAWYATGPQTATGAARTANYGIIANYVGNTSTGSIQDAWIIQNAVGGGTWFGNGVYSNSGCEAAFGLTPTCVVDKGGGTFNAGLGFWVSGTLDGNGAELYRSGNSIRLDSFSTGWPIILNSTGGIGVNATPSNDTFTSALGFFLTGNNIPLTGEGISILYDTTNHNAGIVSVDYGTTTYHQLIIGGSNIFLAPGNNGSNAVVMTTGELYPNTDNQVALGDDTVRHRFSAVSSALYTADANSLAAGLPVPITGTLFHGGGADGVTSRAQLDAFGAIAAFTGAVYGGTNAARTAVTSGTELASLNSYAYNGTSLVGPIASFRTYAAENIASGHQGSQGCIATTTNATTTLANGLCQNNDRGVTLGSPTGGSKGADTLNSAGAIYVNNVAVLTSLASLTFGTHLTSGGSSYNGSTGVTITSDATNANTASTIVARDGSGNFLAGTITASLTGHSSLDCALAGCNMTGNLQVSYASANFTIQDTGTSYAFFQIIGSGGGGTVARMRIGSEGASGGALFTGSANNASVIGTIDNNPLQMFTSNTLRATVLAGGGFVIGAGSNSATASSGELGFSKISASGTAPAAGFAKIEAVAGTNVGSCKIIAYAGTSTTPVTIVDNVGTGC